MEETGPIWKIKNVEGGPWLFDKFWRWKICNQQNQRSGNSFHFFHPSGGTGDVENTWQSCEVCFSEVIPKLYALVCDSMEYSDVQNERAPLLGDAAANGLSVSGQWPASGGRYSVY